VTRDAFVAPRKLEKLPEPFGDAAGATSVLADSPKTLMGFATGLADGPFWAGLHRRFRIIDRMSQNDFGVSVARLQHRSRHRFCRYFLTISDLFQRLSALSDCNR
jgi:hypothetical protein